MEFARERLVIIIACGVAIVALGLYLFLYGPLIGKLREAYLKCRAVETEAMDAREAIANLKTLETKKGLISEDEISLAIDELTRRGKSKGINFISMTPKKIEQSNDSRYRTLPMEMEIESSYEALGVFLGLLDELEKSLVRVRSFNVTSDKEKGAKLNTRLVVDTCLSGI